MRPLTVGSQGSLFVVVVVLLSPPLAVALLQDVHEVVRRRAGVGDQSVAVAAGAVS
jgi:hypothetical protein